MAATNFIVKIVYPNNFEVLYQRTKHQTTPYCSTDAVEFVLFVAKNNCRPQAAECPRSVKLDSCTHDNAELPVSVLVGVLYHRDIPLYFPVIVLFLHC